MPVFSVIGGEDKKVGKPTVITHSLTDSMTLKPCEAILSQYKFVELISLGYCTEYDLIFAHDGDRATGVLYIGKWNDGFVNQ